MFFNKRRQQDEDEIWRKIDEEDDLVIYLSYYVQSLKNRQELRDFCGIFQAYKENAIAAEEELGLQSGKKTNKLKKIELEMEELLDKLSAEAQQRKELLEEGNINFNELLSKIDEARNAIKALE